MQTPDDPFIRFLVSLSGQTVAFVPGIGGIDDALTSLAFHDLCERHGVACGPLSQDSDTVVVGSLAVASSERVLSRGRRVVVLPGSISRFEDLASDLGDSVTIFWRDRHSSRRAELQGASSQQTIRCHDLTIHLDATKLVPDLVAGSGMLTIGTDEQSAPSSGDQIEIRLDGSFDRWGSQDVCRDAARSIARLMACRAEISTDSPCIAILAAQMGKMVRLSVNDSANRDIADNTIVQLYPDVTLTLQAAPFGLGRDRSRVTPQDESPTISAVPELLGAELVRLKALVTAARRESQFVAQERDHLVVVAADLQERLDAGVVSLAQSYREAERRTAERLTESERQIAEQRQAATTATAAMQLADARLGEAMEKLARSSQIAATDRLTEAAAREASLQRRMADLDAAFAARSQQILALQAALDEQRARSFSSEGVIAQMRDMIERRTMTVNEMLRDNEMLGRRLDAVLSSTSWRILRPVRGVGRVLQRLTGTVRGAQRG